MRIAAILLAAACAAGPHATDESQTPQIVDGELVVDHDRGSDLPGYRLRDPYVAVWAKAGTVRVTLRSSGDAAVYCGEQAGTDLSFQVPAARQTKFWVVSKEEVDSTYQLVIDPPPYNLFAPPRNDAAGRKEEYLKRQRPMEAFGRPLERSQRSDLEKFELDGKAVPARLEAFAGMELPLQADHCYRLLLRLGEGAALSEVAQRGLDVDFSAGAKHADESIAFRGGVLTRELCAPVAATARLLVKTRLKTAENELGTGPLSVEVYKRADGKFAEPAAARDRVIAKETRGFSPVKTVAARLETFKGIELPLRRGGCYAMVVKLGPGAHFSDEVHADRDLSFGLQTADGDGSAGPGLVGPGGVGVFACRQRNEKGRFKLGIHDQPLGAGPVTVQILGKTVSEAQLRREAAADRAERIATERQMREMKADACKTCIEEKISCHHRGGGDCYDSFLTCVRSKGYAESTCGG